MINNKTFLLKALELFTKKSVGFVCFLVGSESHNRPGPETASKPPSSGGILMVVGLAAASIFPWDAHFSVHLLGLICLVIGDLAG